MLRRAGLKSQAIATCVKHIEYFPKSADAHKDYGATLAEYGRKDDAIEEYKKVLNLDPNDAESKKELGTLTGN
jgi:Flp pilus assembly protein TadD